MQAQERRAVQRKHDLDVVSVRRNPYLVDYEEQKRLRVAVNESPRRVVRGKNPVKRRRRKRMIRRKVMAAVWILCIFMTGWLFLLKKGNASELEQNDSVQRITDIQEEDQSASSTVIQGISSKMFAKHPAWTEDFLPMNEYSRPGETLPEVRDIFVHYTANPGTSAAQNRSYFEQQKDMHEASVSAHFIIGYEGEIIQCIG